MQEDCGQI